ncbi:MAG TPA: hypothetical protein VNG13_15350 [Mycobacteriales bacterium]|nr:hypothetical protein [Mycobacteriales bacterium]
MRTVLCRTAGRAALILALAGVVGSVASPAVSANAEGRQHVASSAARHHARHARGGSVQIGTAVAYVREPDGSVREIR